ncbi:cytochrome P450 [Streptomyces sp. NA04227]|uniref:cytochrome P450 n=1 Tax=Streptomyces sp. NA04227 TaxID=2742136 RepID=UPI0015902B4F|nr:cytochrome P450 [Streptomyces sp. NA04227]QKW08529.1 cytochrome P450 [Streptomyces sp. NA04227]
MESQQGADVQAAPAGCPMHQSGRVPLYGDEFAAAPQKVYDELRAQGPVAAVEIAPGVDASLVIQHDAALRVLQNPSLFARDARRWDALNEGRVPADSPALGMMSPRPNALFSDGAEHLRLRKAVTESMARINTARLGRSVERIADYLIDQFSERGHADLLNEYARLVPMLLINQLFGCPAEIGDRVTHNMSALFNGEDVARSLANLDAALLELVAIKRRQPGEDMTSWLVQHPAGLSDEELKDQLMMLAGAGIEPERNLIGSSLLLLLSEQEPTPGNRGAGLLVEDAIDQVLWHHSPIANYAAHYPVQDVDLDGTILRANSPVLISFAAANSDPVLTDARQTLSKGAHLSWGAGPHACPAKSPATLIALTAVERLLNALPDMALTVPAGELAWRPGCFHRALAALPVRFTPSPAGRATAQRQPPVSFSTTAEPAPVPIPVPQAAEAPKKTKGWWSSFLDVFRV